MFVQMLASAVNPPKDQMIQRFDRGEETSS